MKIETIQLVEGREDITLTSYILDVYKEPGTGVQKRPAVIICPGGAYMTLSEHEGEPVAMAFAQMGYHAFVLRYHVYGPMAFGASPEDFPPKPENTFPEPMRDIARAFLVIRSNAEEWGVDADRIAVCGFSAGAHNAAMYGTYWARPEIQEYFRPAIFDIFVGSEPEQSDEKDDLSESVSPLFRPAACILGYGLSDYKFMVEKVKTLSPMDQNFNALSNLAFFGTPTPTEEQLIAASPALLVDKYTPPMFLWATATDEMVPAEHTLRMAMALAQHNIPYEVHIFEEGPHGIVLGTQATAVSQSRLFPKVSKWVGLCDTWLQKYLGLDLPAKSKWEEMMEQDTIF